MSFRVNSYHINSGRNKHFTDTVDLQRPVSGCVMHIKILQTMYVIAFGADWVWPRYAGQQSNSVDPRTLLDPNKNTRTQCNLPLHNNLARVTDFSGCSIPQIRQNSTLARSTRTRWIGLSTTRCELHTELQWFIRVLSHYVILLFSPFLVKYTRKFAYSPHTQ
jgi:hypothetical protein